MDLEVFFKLNNILIYFLNVNTGALYYSTFPYENLNFIGAIGNLRPR